MESWLHHPVFQSAVAPLAVSLAVAVALIRLRLSGLAVAAGTLACVYLTVGLEFQPLTATRRIVALAIAATIVGVVLDQWRPPTQRGRHWPFALVGAAAVSWVLLAALSNKEVGIALALGAGMAAFAALVFHGFDRLSAQPLSAGSGALAAGLGTGAAATLGASASLGQIALAVGAAAGGYTLVALMRGGRLAGGRALTLASSTLVGLTAAGAVVLARMPWTALPAIAAVPYIAGLPAFDRLPLLLSVVARSLAALTAAALAAVLSWHAAGPPPSGY